MADYRNDDDPTLPGATAGINRTPETDPEHLLPDHTAAPAVPGTIGGGVTGDPDAVRDEIERTRARMSSTIDQIEGALHRKKGEIQERLDVVAPIRERPWIFAAGVFGTGLALGLLTGGRDDDDRDHVKVPRAWLAGMGLEGDDGGARLGLTGSRGTGSRDLLQVVARQEEEIRDLRAALYDEDYAVDAYADLGSDGDHLVGADALGDVDDEWDEEWNYDDQGDALDDFGAFGVAGESRGVLRKAVAAAVAAGLAGVIGGVGKKLVGGRGRSDGLEVEVDLERGAASGGMDRDYRAARDDGELEVEVELDRTRPYAGRYSVPQPDAPHDYDLPAVRTRSGRELEVEVELERGRAYSAHSEGRRARSLPVSPLAGAVAAGAAALVGGLVAKLMHDRSRGDELDVEVELEGGGGRRGYTSSPQPISDEREYEVALEEGGDAARYQAAPASAEREYEVDLEGREGPSTDDATQAEWRDDRSEPPLM
jgi:hypothetical protein